MSLSNKTVLVTGSSRGIGRAIAFAFGRAGYRVVINGANNKHALEETASLLKKEEIPVLPIFTDVSVYENCKAMFQEIEATFGSVDILINNAGISHIGLFSDMTPDQWRHIMAVNLDSVFHCTHLAVPSMVQKKQGIILNISSMWGERGASCEAVYSASKGGMNAFTKAMAKELAPSGIRVNAISCGVIDTDMNRCFDEEERQALLDEIPLMRFGTGQDVAQLALFLASEKSRFLTGQVVSLDGGMDG